MGNDKNEYERLWKLLTAVSKLVMEGKRSPAEVSDILQTIIEKQTEKFALLVDLGTITVPADYVHATALARFRKQNQYKFYYYPDAITDANFPNPTRILKAGDVLHVRVYGQTVAGDTTKEQRMELLHSKQAIFTGAQGATIVYEQKLGLLPKGKWYASMDEKSHLCQYSGGDAMVPGVYANSLGEFAFEFSNFGRDWSIDCVLLCFSDE